MLVVSPNSQGICALMVVGETITSGAAMPLKYTRETPSLVGSASCVVSAEAVWYERLVPCTWAMVPGARDAASPPPERSAPLVVPVIPAVVAVETGVMVQKIVVALPLTPVSRDVSNRAPVARSGVAYTLVSPAPLLAALIKFTSAVMMVLTVSVDSTVYL